MAYETYTVKKGDSLWLIAKNKLGDGTKWKQLAKLNNISLRYPLIRVGQVIKIDIVNDKPTKVPKNNSNKAKISNFGLQSDSDNTVFATWIWDKSNTDNYRAIWYYDTGNGVWFVGSDSTVNIKQSTYSIPSNAHRVRFKVKPIAKKRKVNKKEVAYWNADWSTIKEYNVRNNPPSIPSGLKAEIKKLKLTAEIDNVDVNATHIEFQVVSNNSKVYKTGMSEIKKAHASFSCTISIGRTYKVRCRAYRKKDKKYSGWSDYTENMTTIPSTPKILTKKTLSETSVQITWKQSAINNVTGYDIEYTTKRYYFNSSTEVKSMSLDLPLTHAEITGLDSGELYYCRIRSKNDKGTSGWSNEITFITGKKPAAPTTWSSTSTAIAGESVYLYWVHNSQDNSSQTYAQLELIVDGNKTISTIKNSTDEDKKDKTSVKSLSTYDYTEGCVIKWRVRTAGITNVYGDWSVQRTITVYARPTLDITVNAFVLTTTKPTDWDKNYTNYYIKGAGDFIDVEESTSPPEWVENTYYTQESKYSADDNYATIDSFPFFIGATCGPDTQEPISYHVEILSYSEYYTVDDVGEEKVVSKGESVYSKNFDIDYKTYGHDFSLMMTPSFLNIENNRKYKLKITVSMNSGLIASESMILLTSWIDEEYNPEVSITVDPDSLIAYINPSCKAINYYYYLVEQDPISGMFYVETESCKEDILEISAAGDTFHIGLDSNDETILYIIEYTDPFGEVLETPLYKKVIETYVDSAYVIYYEDIPDPSTIKDIYTTNTGEKVYLGCIWNDDSPEVTRVLYCIREGEEYIPNVTLSVYRKEFDGTFTEIMSDLDNVGDTYIIDPHPALDYARYRIVATESFTGAITYYDPPGIPIGEKSAIIQWDEKWHEFATDVEDALEEPPWSGSMIKLPYNLDVSDKYSPDVSLISYIGREHPVSYYGTQIGQTQSWNVDVDKTDEETLNLIRRLAIYRGDVYVREPSGSGYWANVKVSFSKNHCDVTMPVSIEITRVEGGV